MAASALHVARPLRFAVRSEGPVEGRELCDTSDSMERCGDGWHLPKKCWSPASSHSSFPSSSGRT